MVPEVRGIGIAPGEGLMGLTGLKEALGVSGAVMRTRTSLGLAADIAGLYATVSIITSSRFSP